MAAPALLPLKPGPAASKGSRLDCVKERGRFIEGRACFERVILLSWACFVYSSERSAASPDLDLGLLLACSSTFHLYSWAFFQRRSEVVCYLERWLPL